MNRRSLLKGLATLPFLRHLNLDLDTPVEAAPEPWEMTLAEEGLSTGDGRVIDWPSYNHWSSWGLDSGPIDLGIARGGWCAPMQNSYVLFTEEFERPIRDALPVFRAPRGGIRYFKPE